MVLMQIIYVLNVLATACKHLSTKKALDILNDSDECLIENTVTMTAMMKLMNMKMILHLLMLLQVKKEVLWRSKVKSVSW
jgi:hypothetical protein